MRRWSLGLLLAGMATLVGCIQPVPTPSPTPLPAATPTPALHSQEAEPTPSPRPTPTATATPTAVPAPVSTFTPVPTATPTPLPTPTPTPSQGARTQLPIPPDLDRYALAQRLGPASGHPIPTLTPQESPQYTVGHRDTFQLVDVGQTRLYTIEAELRLVSQHAYWYVERGLDISPEQLQAAAQVFEEKIRPTVVSYFADWWKTGASGGPRLTILHAHLRGAAGYYSSSDEYPRAVHPASNERKAIYLDGEALEVGSPGYYGVLAHELQHALHWNQDPGEEAWVNEGLSEVASFLAGYPPNLESSYREHPQAQLNTWSEPPESALAHYAGSYLFLLYLATHYGGYESLRRLVAQPSDGIDGINAYLELLGHEETFQDVFRDWVVANYLPQGQGRYAYPIEQPLVPPTTTLLDYRQNRGTVPQFSARYVEVRLGEGAARITFQGATTARLLPTEPTSGAHCWWSNLGDSIDSRLIREVDLTGVEKATLTFRTWYDIEAGWDYAYVVVSRDGGKTWDVLEGRHTSSQNPVGAASGPALTGKSDGWIEERVDLSPYAGERVLVGFEYVTDDVFSGNGLCLDDIAIPEVAYFDDAETPGEWQAQGFTRITNLLPQEFIVQVVGLRRGQVVFVEELALDEENRGSLLVEGFGDTLDAAVVVIAPVTRVTRQPASYTLTVGRP